MNTSRLSRSNRFAWLLAAAITLGSTMPRATASEPSFPHNWRTFTTHDGLPDNRIRTLEFIGDTLWVGTRGGLAKLTADQFASWTVDDGLPHPDVTAIGFDPATEDMWIGSWGGGVARLTAGRFDVFSQINSGLPGNLVFDLLVHQGNVWVATNAGTCCYNPGNNTWQLFLEHRANRPQIVVTDLCVADGELLASTWHEGLWRFDSAQREWRRVDTAARQGRNPTVPPRRARIRSRWSPESFPQEKKSAVVTAAGSPTTRLDINATAAISVSGNAHWLATQTDIARRTTTGNWMRRTIPMRTPNAFVHTLAGNGASSVWLGTNEGLLVLSDWDSGSWLSIRHVGSSGGGGGVITTIENGKPTGSLTTGTIIPDDRVRCLAITGKDIWIGTAGGLTRGSDPAPLSRIREAGVRSVPPTRPHTTTPTPPKKPRPGAYASRPSYTPAAIAILGPRSKTVPIPGQKPTQRGPDDRPDLVAVQLAIEAVNKNGGYRTEAPFDLIMAASGYGHYGWGTPQDDFALFAGYDNVLGIVGSIGPGDRVNDAVAFMTELPFVNVISNRAAETTPVRDNPWVFECAQDAPRQHRKLLDHILDGKALKRIAILRTANPDSRPHLDWWRSHAINRGNTPVLDLPWPDDPSETAATVSLLCESKVDVVLAWPDAKTGAAIVRALRAAGLDQLFVGGKPIVSTDFLEGVGEKAGSVMALYSTPRRADTQKLAQFASRYAKRNIINSVPTAPDRQAYASYLATQHLLTAINKAGTNREAVTRQLTMMSRSVDGEEHYEQLFGPTTVGYALLEKEGRWSLPLPSEEPD